ncbi:T9SS type A sorting domain-containing protein [bacterium]|nr:MAG: T9SS type A sorting domain-containing protein [bacterium]
MKSILRAYLFLGLLLTTVIVKAQVITPSPAFPTENSSIIITFFANEGSKGLMGYTGDVYAHTGVITDKSTSNSDWKYVKTGWGVNTPATKLTRIDTDTYTLTIGNPRTYYAVAENDTIKKIAFVFRSSDSKKEGKDVGGNDIFQNLYVKNINVRIDQPYGNRVIVEVDSTISVLAVSGYTGAGSLTMSAFLNGSEVTSIENDTLTADVAIVNSGINVLKVFSTDGTETDSVETRIFALPEVMANTPRPEGIVDGINKTGPNSVILSLYAPQKSNVFVIGDFNNWSLTDEHFMNRHEVNQDSVHFWVEINNLDPNTEYAFQYLVDGTIITGDPYSEKVLDPWNDQWVNEKYLAYPNIKPYPTGKTDGIVSVFQIQEDEYEWKVENFERPPQDALVFYELLIRDFASKATYRTLIDTLGYFKRLGINAIKLMPIAEFDGNDSWGYNPAYHMALDKYYGTKNDLKEFIDSCHVNGIAVVIDVVFNHATDQSPLIKLYPGASGGAGANSIYAFTSARHPYNVFNDLNHGSKATNFWMKKVLKYWLEEFNIDGFRFDLSKGHYIGNTTDVNTWSSYNSWRINHWKDNYNFIQSVKPGSFVVLEHLAVDSEETALANYGLLLWGKMTEPFNELTMGWNMTNSASSLFRTYYTSRGFSTTGLIGYMESHDEERLMFKNKMYGNTSVATHNAKLLENSTRRTSSAAAFLFSTPGPKMMWMFGELGYDVSINQVAVNGTISEDHRTWRKPILWDYYNDPNRLEMYKRFGDLIKLRTQNPVFYAKESSFKIFEDSPLRRIELIHETNKVVVAANFDFTAREMRFDFPEDGKWYEFFSGDSLDVINTAENYIMQPAELRIYSKVKFDITPESSVATSNESDENRDLPTSFNLYQNYPNPFNPSTIVNFDMPKSGKVSIDVYDVLGRKVVSLLNEFRQAGTHEVRFDATGLSSGMYLIRMQSGGHVQVQKAILAK